MDDGNIEPVATLPTLPRGHPQHSQFVASNNYSRPGLTTNNGYSTTSSYNTHLTQESGLVRYLPSRIQALLPTDYWGRVAIGWSVVQFIFVGILEIALAVQHYFYVAQLDALTPWSFPLNPTKDDIVGNGHAITVYHSLVCFALLFQLVMVYDAIANKSVIQLCATTLFNWSVSIYTIVQSRQAGILLNDAPQWIVADLSTHPTLPLEIVIIVSMFVFAPGWIFMSYQLYKVFGWTIFKELGADVNVRNQLMVHHVHLLLLKLDVFFFLGFSFQFVCLVLAGKGNTGDSILHAIISVPGTIILLIISYIAIRRESKLWMIVSILGLLGGSIYLIVKIVEVNGSSIESVRKFHSSKNSLTFFIVLTLLMSGITCVSAILNYLQFGKGLKDHLDNHKRPAGSVELEHLSQSNGGMSSHGKHGWMHG
ncbi:hypothetical protein BATDEDRAFT_34822 [Batrachochytrium dendrobatidis JAM81]|uniref:Uncharacterized protein n=2 Tax=Batrachochytrium dendrobatidis TaxID=109871 RepID=F4NZR4_BATDJ|nr:uncharacterized protein BATDEDRAFT_34822 [Batrachochytrium dendrobatidis JAM81]EGF81230.1 hypothetical protein BATDEDRAFT_34822 [Batrachochytrium dendrobatidis JAM81]KAJ8325945.1 hypothetical protein O5D80_005586 [Batrachochytrium dendrobatidis]KAK5669721.1 hypothetical protein QVD99_004107 [Batrachochytrium dendrobatidis]OAJ38250.1 hypothetical protein BDEG_22199 [Batrachochytrium dendrobatidis JEL423]|eukprot:XP_006678015.1 hypothetical protein BATDEDRAFT_34822 [Batrachochytrium dendrobatidis JAM81]